MFQIPTVAVHLFLSPGVKVLNTESWDEKAHGALYHSGALIIPPNPHCKRFIIITSYTAGLFAIICG